MRHDFLRSTHAQFSVKSRTNDVGLSYTTRSAVKSWRMYGNSNVAIFNSFNFISSFVFCIQLCVQYSTCIQHSTRYSMFNFPFNIQLFILYSILHSPIQLSIQQFQPFIQHSTLIFKTFNYSLDCLQSTFSLKIRLVLDLIPRDCKPRCYYIGIETRRDEKRRTADSFVVNKPSVSPETE